MFGPMGNLYFFSISLKMFESFPYCLNKMYLRIGCVNTTLGFNHPTVGYFSCASFMNHWDSLHQNRHILRFYLIKRDSVHVQVDICGSSDEAPIRPVVFGALQRVAADVYPVKPLGGRVQHQVGNPRHARQYYRSVFSRQCWSLYHWAGAVLRPK